MFLHSHFLWLLLLPPLLAVWHLRSPAEVAGQHKLSASGLRLLALSLLVLALARPFQHFPETARRVVAVIDCSPSMDAAAMEQAAAELQTLADRAGRGNVRLVIFGTSAREVALDDAVPTADDLAKLRFGEPGSAVAEALELAAALCPDDANGDVHLFSDGRETRGDMVGAAARLGRRGLELKIHELGSLVASPVLLLKARAPGAVAVGEAATFFADVECRSAGEAMLRVTDNQGETVASRTVSLRAGVREVPIQVRPERSGLQRYQVSLGGGDQTVSVGMKVSRTVVGVFETAPEAPATRALRNLLGTNAEIKPLTLADLAGKGWDGFDVLAVADTPAAELPVAIQKKLRDWVENGGGLLVTGGRNAFGPGGYTRSEFAGMLPLRFPQKKEVRDPSTSLAIIIDTSSSMGAEGVSLAKEVARLALKRLKPHDKGGIVEFYGAKRWAAPMQPASNSIALQRALNRLASGGGTVMLPAIEEAYYGLLNVRTRTRHVLLITDGGVEQGAFEALLRRMVDDGIHVSAVLIGPRAGSGFLAKLAGWGHGQFYTAPSRFKLPEVIIKQPSSSLLNPFVEKEVRLEPVLASRLTQDMKLEEAPMLRGYVKTEPKDTAELLLRSEIGDPVLARWHYGLGRVAILTTQLGGDWAEDFLNWSPAPDMMANLIRQLAGVSPHQPLALTLDSSSAGLDLGIGALSPDPSLAATPLRIEIRDDKDAPAAKRDIMPVRAHAWSARFENLSAGAYLVEVKDAAGEKLLASGGLVVPPPNEFTRAAPDRDKLAIAARTTRDFAAAADAPETPVRTREFWPHCAALGLLSFILMILVRRLPAASTAPRVARAATTGLALLATLGTLGLSPSAMGQEIGETPSLSPPEEQRIDEFIAMAPADGRQDLKTYCRELTQHHGGLQPLYDYLKSKEKGNSARQLLAVAAIADGNLDLAHDTLVALVAQPDPDLWVFSEMARVQDMRGETAPAVENFKRALEGTKDPGMRFAMQVRIAQLLYEDKKKDAARTVIRDILEEPGFNRPEGRNYCARIAGLHGDYELAGELFTPVGKDRDLMRDQIHFGEILMRLEKPAKAREQFVAALELTSLQRDRRYVLDRIVSAAREAGELPGLMDEWLAAGEMLPEQLEILVGVLGGELDRVEDLLALLEYKDSPAETQKLIRSPGFQERLIMVAIEAGMSGLARRRYLDLIARHPKELHYRNGYARLLLMDGERAEAEDFFRKTIATTETVGGLMGLAAGARNMAMEEISMEAATKAGKMGELAHVQAGLFEAELHRQHGEADKALDVLLALEKEIGEDAELMPPLADAYERYGYQADAIRLVRKAYDLTKSEKLLEKLIALMEAAQQYEEAFILYRQLWENATEPMLVIQAQDRLLDIGARNGRLADIAIELEERLDEGGLSDRELAMLLEIYTSVNDPVSAADILLELSQQGDGDRIGLYLRLVQVYMECELFGRCNVVLRKLIKLDPDNRDDYLQTLALIALERKNDGDAVAVLQELAARTADGMLRDSFSASVLNMIGRYKEAARVYRRAIACNPDEIEVWLLWCNSLLAMDEKIRRKLEPDRPILRRSRRKPQKQATGLFSVLLEESGDDDMFTIALDGLFNARAPQQVLRSALRRVNERIALKPHKMFLYRLAADLHEELQQPDGVRSVMEQSLVVADDERSIILRELSAMAKVNNNPDEVIRYGRSLLNTSEHLPPGECLELGTILLGKGYSSEADSAFQRVIADGDVMGVTRDIILRYENAGLYGKAGKLLRRLLIGNPFDVELLMRLGIMEEKKNNLAAAGKAYQQAIDLMIGRMPRRSRKVEGRGGSMRDSRYQSSYNLNESKHYFDLASLGLIMSARTPESRQQLLDNIQERIRAELKELEADNAFGKNHGENPRLMQIVGLMSRLSVVFHRPEYFSSMKADLRKRYPGGLPSSLRVQWGLIGDTLLISPHLGDHDKFGESIREGRIMPRYAETILPLLAMCGYDDLVDTVLAKVKLEESRQTTALSLATAGLAANRPDLVREVLFNTLSAARRSRRIFDEIELQNQISAAWPVLSEEDRNSVISQHGMIIETLRTQIKPQAFSFHHFLLCLMGRSQEIDLKYLNDYVTGDSNTWASEFHAWGTVIRWLLDKPEAERPEALKQLMEPHNGSVRAVALMQFAMLLDDVDISDELVEVFRELFKPASMSFHKAMSVRLFFSGYRENRLTKLVRKSMANQKVGNLALALLANNGTIIGGDGILSKIKADIARQKPAVAGDIRTIFSLYDPTLRQAAEFLAPEQLDMILEDHIDSNDPVDMLIAFLLLRHAGRETEALTVLERIDALSPEDPRAVPVRAVMPRILVHYAWDARASRFFADSGNDPVTTTLLPFRLHDPLPLLAGNAKDTLTAAARRMHATMLMKYPAQFLQSARIYEADTRHPVFLANQWARYQMRTWPVRMNRAPGGLLGMKSRSSGTLLDDFAGLDGAQEELSRWLSGMPSTEDPRIAALCRALAENVREYGLSGTLRTEIETAAQHSQLNRVDLDAITAIADQAPEQLPATLADQIPLMIVFNRLGQSRQTAAVGRASKALGIDRFALSFNRWSVARDLQTKGTSRWLADYLGELPENARRDILKTLLPYLGLNALRKNAGGDEAILFTALLDLGMETEATDLLELYLRRLRLIDARLASGYQFLAGNNQTGIAGGHPDPVGGALLDAMAAALARLNRPDDYRRVLTRRALLEQCSPLQRSASVPVMTESDVQVPYQNYGSLTGPSLEDHTHALPEPDQVGEIDRYIDIHLEVCAWLRARARLSREHHVARICMLGKWCAERGLRTRAAALLETAGELSAGMLTGRLWIADLHRMLDQEEQAAAIERELLRHDLLPVSRIPAALEVAAKMEGRARADAIAYRVATYSNHPEILPSALRHAQSQDMKPEARDLAERLRKVSTLFLPPDK